jgi:hypothetical protein
MCRRTKAIDAYTLGLVWITHAVGAKANQPRTQQWCGVRVVVRIGDFEAISFVSKGELGEAAIAVVAGKNRCVTQVFLLVSAVDTFSAATA